STQPGRGCRMPTGTLTRCSTVPSMVSSKAFVALVPWSTASSTAPWTSVTAEHVPGSVRDVRRGDAEVLQQVCRAARGRELVQAEDAQGHPQVAALLGDHRGHRCAQPAGDVRLLDRDDGP